MNAPHLGLDVRVPGWPLAGFRIVFGILYLDMAWQKAPWKDYGWLRGFIEQEVAHPASASVAAFLRDVVLPHFAIFGMMTFMMELALGVALVLGILTRLAGIAGFLWQVNIAVQALAVPGEWYWIWPLLALPQLCFALSGAGQILGLDHWLRPWLRQRAQAGAGWTTLLARGT